MTGNEIRREFIEFFKTKNHEEVRSAPVIPYEDPTLLFTNAGMNQFKDIFLGMKQAEHKRVVNSQKCIRAGGKHNDLEEVGLDGFHHTFFEMLGNWSFGDYYKQEAITWAWELLTERWKIPAAKLFATVHHTDEEAFGIWQEFTSIDKTHIEYHGDKDNFWEMGETGPCGPCSEIHIDLGEPACNLKGHKDHKCKVNGDCHRFIELWNLVFIQFYRDTEGNLNPLKNQFVDTGAGFERLCRVLQGKDNNYETDLFIPIIEGITELSGKEYQSAEICCRECSEPTEPGNDLAIENDQGLEHRVIADHIRTLCIALADGGYPSNEGRGYVLRRILRRAARYGRRIGMKKPFLHLLTDKVVLTLGDSYPELREKDVYIKSVIKMEEERFNLTLDKGLEKFSEIIKDLEGETIPGRDVFVLYDTYGFPPDLTELLARENNLRLDYDDFLKEMEKQRKTAREGSSFKMSHYDEDWTVLSSETKSEFVGYQSVETECRIIKYAEISNNQKTEGVGSKQQREENEGSKKTSGENQLVKIILNRTPFYPESGGQVADQGRIHNKETEIRVFDVKRENDLIVHYGELIKGGITGDKYQAEIDPAYRMNIERNHTATHLLHSALREVFGQHIQQKGSLVAADHLRFDFTHFKALDEREIEMVEKLVNSKIRECLPLQVEYKKFTEAKKGGAIALFGEKYEETVRSVKIGEYSYELCGGTHLGCTGEIGLFKIISETASASGIRRITAITGSFAEEYVRRIEKDVSYIAGILNVPLTQLTDRVIKMSEENKALLKEVAKFKQKTAGGDLDSVLKNGVHITEEKIRVVSGKVAAPNSAVMRNLGDILKTKLGSGIGVLGAVIEEKASIVVVVTSDLTKRIKAGDIAAEIAPIVGGKGGGRPDMAMAGGKDAEKLSIALAEVEKIILRLL